MRKSRYVIAKRILIFLTVFIGIGAVAGALAMIIDPSGKTLRMDAMLPYFQKLPFAKTLFQDFTFSGWALLIINDLTNLSAAGLLIAKKPLGVLLGGIFGITLMLWICIQFYMFPLNFMSISYFIFGLSQTITAYTARVFYKQERFCFSAEDYSNVGTNHKRLVVYFSRMGYVRKTAYEEANRTGADIYEIISTERTEGTLGFWWCGRFGMLKREMPIKKVDVDLSVYDHVTICSPVWVFSLCAPVRSFCTECKGKIKEADYVLLHYQNNVYEKIADDMDSMLCIKRTAFKSVRLRTGEFKTLYDSA